MKPFRAVTRLLSLVCAFSLVFALCSCVKQSGTEGVPEGEKLAALGGFSLVSPGPDAATDLTPAFLLYKGKDISQMTDPMREITVREAVEEFPAPGCEGVVVEMFTGGANCCFGYYLLTTCTDGDHAAYMEPADGGLGEPQPGMRAYSVTDTAFFYYSPRDQKKPGAISLSRVDSPRPDRFLVYDNGVWRADKLGEFAAAYKALRAEAIKKKGGNALAKNITVAYYSLMAGDDPATVSRTLERAMRRGLTKQNAHIPAVVFADIQKAVEEFNPVKNLTVSGN